MSFTLPTAIQHFVTALNAFDGPALLACFTDDALVNDNKREFWGKPAIKRFADRELIGDRVSISVLDVKQHYATTIVTGDIKGNFDKTRLPDPVILTFYFTLHGEKIATLFILMNTPANGGGQ